MCECKEDLCACARPGRASSSGIITVIAGLFLYSVASVFSNALGAANCR